MKERGAQGPGPGSYQPIQSMGKQVLSTKTGAVQPAFPKGEHTVHGHVVSVIFYLVHAD
jgi:hypothetical protein